MKAVLMGLGLMVFVSVVAWAVLGTQVTTSGEAFVSNNSSVRLD